jgi:hypothetical protein
MAESPRADGFTRGLEAVRKKIAPLRLSVSGGVHRRVNLLVPSLQANHVFGGRIAQLNLALCLARQGLRARVLFLEDAAAPPNWVARIQRYEGLDDFPRHVEVGWAGDRSVPVEISADDRFIASSWWSAHIAQAACGALGRHAFVYLIQEYQPFAHPLGTWAALAEESYTFPHFALFSTELLRDFFRGRRLGVFGAGAVSGESSSTVFRNALTPIPPPEASELRNRASRRLLLYARPERHAERNMFRLAVLGIRAAIEEGLFREGWELLGVGKQGPAMDLSWGPVRLRLLPRTDQTSYGELLGGCDVGVALQYTAHPGLVPLEMASAGMVAVTNHFENKTPDALRRLSSNIVPVDATVVGIVRGLHEAVRRSEDYRDREAGARLDWPTTWDGAFHAGVVERTLEFLEAC